MGRGMSERNADLYTEGAKVTHSEILLGLSFTICKMRCVFLTSAWCQP